MGTSPQRQLLHLFSYSSTAGYSISARKALLQIIAGAPYQVCAFSRPRSKSICQSQGAPPCIPLERLWQGYANLDKDVPCIPCGLQPCGLHLPRRLPLRRSRVETAAKPVEPHLLAILRFAATLRRRCRTALATALCSLLASAPVGLSLRLTNAGY